MGGQLTLKSVSGQGSTFSFTARLGLAQEGREAVPCTPPVSHAPPSVPKVAATSLKILVAEDSPPNQKLMSVLLGQRGHEVHLAGDGLAVLDLIKRHDFDLVLMDVQMPLMNGLQAAVAIRALSDLSKSRIRIVALTAGAMPEDREQCLAAGMNGYLTKPFDRQQLFEALEQTTPNS